jgi:potassium-transporting ATPase potassium-binding subunit
MGMAAMDLSGWLQLALFVGLLFAVTKPVGVYLFRVLDPGGKTWLDRPVKPIERLFYRILGVDPKAEQDWRRYALSLIVFSLAGMLFTYAVLRLQHRLPFNPQGFGPVKPDLAFNTAASFASNTNWQNYAGETTLSYFSQMVGLVFQNFVSSSIILSPRRPVSPRPRRLSGASPGIRPRPSETSGSISSGSTFTSFSPFRSSSRSS